MTLILYTIELILPYAFSKFIDEITLYKSSNIIWGYAKWIAILSVIYLVIFFYKEIIFAKCTAKVRYSMLDEAESHIEKLSLNDISRFNPAYLNQRLNDDILNIILFVFNNLCNSIMKILSTIVLGAMILSIDVKLFIVLVLVIVINSIGIIFFNKELFKKGYRYRDANNDFYAANNDRLKMIKQTKSNSWFDVIKIRVEYFYDLLLDRNIDFTKVSAKLQNVGLFSKYISIVLLIIFGGYKIINGNLSMGQFILIYNYANICISNVEYFLSLGQNYQHAKVCYERMNEILTLKPEHNGTKIIGDIDSIELKDLYFSYNNKRELYFGLNFSLKKGKIYCLKGENGSGKSTLIDIITGLRYDYKGDVLYNNISIKELDANYLRRHLISIVEQEPDLINISLKENLTFGIKSYDRDYLKRLCSEFYIEKRIDSHNENLNLSGGEKQKIALVRGVIKKPKFMILDEPISALDYNSILKLKSILKEEKKDKIILMITHNEEIEDIVDEFITLGKYKSLSF